MRSLARDFPPGSFNALSNSPATQPPAGVESNFSNPRNQSQLLLVVTSFLLGIMGIFFLIRVYTKSFMVRKYSWDDLTMIFAVLGSAAFYAASVWGVRKGKLGVHYWDITVLEVSRPDLLVPLYMLTVVFPLTMMFIKITFFFLYLQIFQPMRWLRICAYIGAVFTSLFYLAMTVVLFISSTPRPGETWFSHLAHQNHLTSDTAAPQAVGDPAVPQVAGDIGITQAVVGLAIDIYILVLPIIAVSRLQMPTRRRIGVMLIFLTGLLACLSSLLSIYYRKVLIHSNDVTWAEIPVIIVSMVEMFVGIICACTPAVVHACRHNIASCNTLKTRFLSHSDALRSNFKGMFSPSPWGSKDIKLGKQQRKDTYSGHGPYSNIEGYQFPLGSDMPQGQRTPACSSRGEGSMTSK